MGAAGAGGGVGAVEATGGADSGCPDSTFGVSASATGAACKCSFDMVSARSDDAPLGVEPGGGASLNKSLIAPHVGHSNETDCTHTHTRSNW